MSITRHSSLLKHLLQQSLFVLKKRTCILDSNEATNQTVCYEKKHTTFSWGVWLVFHKFRMRTVLRHLALLHSLFMKRKMRRLKKDVTCFPFFLSSSLFQWAVFLTEKWKTSVAIYTSVVSRYCLDVLFIFPLIGEILLTFSFFNSLQKEKFADFYSACATWTKS